MKTKQFLGIFSHTFCPMVFSAIIFVSFSFLLLFLCLCILSVSCSSKYTFFFCWLNVQRNSLFHFFFFSFRVFWWCFKLNETPFFNAGAIYRTPSFFSIKKSKLALFFVERFLEGCVILGTALFKKSTL